jgi:hypothetical protein
MFGSKMNWLISVLPCNTPKSVKADTGNATNGSATGIATALPINKKRLNPPISTAKHNFFIISPPFFFALYI